MNSQPGWLWCRKCCCLFHPGGSPSYPEYGFCAAGGYHDPGASAAYSVPTGPQSGARPEPMPPPEPPKGA